MDSPYLDAARVSRMADEFSKKYFIFREGEKQQQTLSYKRARREKERMRIEVNCAVSS